MACKGCERRRKAMRDAYERGRERLRLRAANRRRGGGMPRTVLVDQNKDGEQT